MKTWWLELSSRDKLIWKSILTLSAILFIYIFIWSSLSDSNQKLRNSIAHNKILLPWMQAMDKRINLVEKSSTAQTINTASSLQFIQSALTRANLTSNVVLLQQKENDLIQLKLQKVSFDILMKWLIGLSTSVTVTDINIISMGPGIVDSEIVFQTH